MVECEGAGETDGVIWTESGMLCQSDAVQDSGMELILGGCTGWGDQL
jgi:hypothetical protein